MKISVLFLILILGFATTRESFASAVLQPRTQSAVALRQKTLKVEAETNGDFVHVRETLVFANPIRAPREADFTYSAPEGALICGFAYWYGEEKVVARVVEKRRSEEIYQLITRPRRDPALVEMLGKNRFRARIFPVLANADLKVEVQYLQTLPSLPKQQSARWSFDIGEEKEQPLESVEVELKGDATKRFKHSNLLKREGDSLRFAATQFTGKEAVSVDLAAASAPIRGTVATFRQKPNDGFFAIALSCNSTLSSPRPKVQGAGVFDVLSSPPTRLLAGDMLLVTGRYRQGGRAIVSLGARSFTFDLPTTASQNDASLWWASEKLASLSSDESFRETATALSMRFGLPCRWTNWLAIPEAERKAFEQLLATSRYGEALRNYAQAVAVGNPALATKFRVQVQQLHRQLKFNGEPSFQDNLQWELERIVAMKKSVQSPQTKNRYAVYERNLRKTGVLTYQEQYQREAKATERARVLKGRVYSLMEQGKMNEAQRVDQQAQRALKEAPSSLYMVKEWAIKRGVEVASGIWKERHAGVADSPRQQDLLKRLHNLAPATGYNDTQLLEIARSNLYYSDWQQLANQLNEQIISGDEDQTKLDAIRDRMATIAPLITHVRRDEYDEDYGANPKRTQGMVRRDESTAYAVLSYKLARKYVAQLQDNPKDEAGNQALRAQLERAVALSKGVYHAPPDAQKAIDWAWVEALQKENEALGLEIAKRQENSPRAQEIRARIRQAFSLGAKKRAEIYPTGIDDNSHKVNFAWRARAHETAYRLLEARRKQDEKLAVILQQRLEEEAARSLYPWEDRSLRPEAFLKWEQKRITHKQTLLSAEQYFLHPGDPLISLKTPYRCRRVVAITPDGQVLDLRFDALRGVWEARFDVPMGQSDGAYAVQVLAVEESGARHHLTLSYDLDTTPSSANANIEGDGQEHRIQVQSDGSGDRAHAILPWGERLELPRNPDGSFGATFKVPETVQGAHEPIRVIVTDAAHNRTELWAEWK